MRWNGEKKRALTFGLAMVLLLAAVIHVGRYVLFTKKEELPVSLRVCMEETGVTVKQQVQLTLAVSTQEKWIDNKFYKKGGVYLIDHEEQLYQMRYLIKEGEEIEPGVPAASASYRLRRDIAIGNNELFSIGTRERPFCGSFDGDGHCITGRFLLEDGEKVPEDMLFYMDVSAKIDNLGIYNDLSGGEVSVTVSERRECEELKSVLEESPGCSIRLEMTGWDLDAERIAEVLRGYWENLSEDGDYVSAVFYPDMEEKPADTKAYTESVQKALCAFAGEEYAKAIEEALAREEGYLWFVRLERIGDLTCCTFEIGEPVYQPITHYYEAGNLDNIVYTDAGYYIALSGAWEKEEISCQSLRVPYTKMAGRSVGIWEDYRVERVDLNFDGKGDLLLHEGTSGGTGGHWKNYRAAVWEEEKGQFAYFPSLPEQITSLELENRRVVVNRRSGLSYQVVEVYEVVNGEYICTRELICESEWNGDVEKVELSYYEMGEPVETYLFSDWEEMEVQRDERYPDLNYWPKG